MGDVQQVSDWATGARGRRQATHLAPLFIPLSDEQPLRAPGDRLTYDDLSPHPTTVHAKTQGCECYSADGTQPSRGC